MEYMERNGMQPILDPLHHISFPDWLTDGFANPDFPKLYERFICAVARRYPWAEAYTVFNEPLPTTLFCSLTGMWYPHGKSDDSFTAMALNVARAICSCSAALRRINPDIKFVHIDTSETHRAVDKKSEEWTAFANARRFLMHDLAFGRVDRTHPLYGYLIQHGMTESDLSWLRDHRAPVDIIGLDYYIHSEIEWYWDAELGRANISWPVANPVGFAAVADEYVQRFNMPVMLTETNLRGTYLDRLTWLKFMEEQAERFAARADFRGFCWYPSIDSTDWCHCCTKCTGTVDPQGIWYLDKARWERHSSELSDYYTRLARGEAASVDLPAYRFTDDARRHVSGYESLMSHWDWREQEILRAA
jgi:beta-glucosidase/6-phospho-beta-glucosidase/beta-galactosidase